MNNPTGSDKMEFEHTPVLLDECIENLNIKPNGVYLDGTLGGAGHSLEILKRLDKGFLVGVDRDENAVNKAELTLTESGAGAKFKIIRSDFSKTEYVCNQAGVDAFDGILLDLGVSSHQLDEPSRGFSYMHDAPLDMRMDNRQTFSAYDVINTYDEKQLARILFDYSEERWAVRIAQFIVNERQAKPVETTFELVSIIKKAIPKAARTEGPHPAKRTFQAVRIEVNNELGILRQAVFDLCGRLNANGRICIITFHSLEDRIIKNAFKELENPCVCPRDFPVCICGKKPVIKAVTKRPVLPSAFELENNHRARSAKLRAAERL